MCSFYFFAKEPSPAPTGHTGVLDRAGLALGIWYLWTFTAGNFSEPRGGSGSPTFAIVSVFEACMASRFKYVVGLFSPSLLKQVETIRDGLGCGRHVFV